MVLGAYAYGSFYGLTLATYQFVEAARYLNEVLKHLGMTGNWTAVCLSWNAPSRPHRDSNTSPMTYNQTIAFGDFTGGRLWIEDVDGNGKYHDTKEKIFTFDAHLRHCAEDWEGERFTLTTYTPRGGEHLNQVQKDTLRTLGFPIGRRRFGEKVLDNATKTDLPTRTQPKKGTRKTLWKNALKVYMLFAVTLNAINSVTAELYGGCQWSGRTAILEVGGTANTCAAATFGKDVVEPMETASFRADSGTSR